MGKKYMTCREGQDQRFLWRHDLRFLCSIFLVTCSMPVARTSRSASYRSLCITCFSVSRVRDGDLRILSSLDEADGKDVTAGRGRHTGE